MSLYCWHLAGVDIWKDTWNLGLYAGLILVIMQNPSHKIKTEKKTKRHRKTNNQLLKLLSPSYDDISCCVSKTWEWEQSVRIHIPGTVPSSQLRVNAQRRSVTAVVSRLKEKIPWQVKHTSWHESFAQLPAKRIFFTKITPILPHKLRFNNLYFAFIWEAISCHCAMDQWWTGVQ